MVRPPELATGKGLPTLPPSPATARRWGAFEIRPVVLATFKSILERDFGTPLPWSDDEIKEMAHNVLHLLDVLIDTTPEGDQGAEPDKAAVPRSAKC
jgi:hypothetical protein